jgi:ABC-2 type transport system permease protein
LDFLAGNFFPIDILPEAVARLLILTPFPYMFYFPVKIYLGQLYLAQIIQGFSLLLFWSFLLIYAVSHVWKKGLQIYSAEGR